MEKKFVTFEQLSQISSVCDFSAGRFAPLHGADGEADRWEFPLFCKDCPQGANSQPGTPPGAVRKKPAGNTETRREYRNPQGIQKPVIGRKPTRLGTGRSN
ncbi:hypothetical protein [Bacteroides sp. f07]|uniref:hypothetical protein n=1 Tax=Bacteroides sp. f07 TaxID=3132704 RepID=UPI0036F3A1E7